MHVAADFVQELLITLILMTLQRHHFWDEKNSSNAYGYTLLCATPVACQVHGNLYVVFLGQVIPADPASRAIPVPSRLRSIRSTKSDWRGKSQPQNVVQVL